MRNSASSEKGNTAREPYLPSIWARLVECTDELQILQSLVNDSAAHYLKVHTSGDTGTYTVFNYHLDYQKSLVIFAACTVTVTKTTHLTRTSHSPSELSGRETSLSCASRFVWRSLCPPWPAARPGRGRAPTPSPSSPAGTAGSGAGDTISHV